MKITLKRADAIQKQLSKILDEDVLVHNSVISISIHHENPTEKVQSCRTDFFDRKNKTLRIVDLIGKIRNLIGQANQGEINRILTEINTLNRKIHVLNSFKPASVRMNDLEILAMISHAKSDTSLGRISQVMTGILTREEIDQIVDEGKTAELERQKLQDQLTSLNITTTIDLEESDIQSLKQLKLL